MKTERRAFMQVVGALPAAVAASSIPMGGSAAGAELRRSHFQPLLGQNFSVAGEGTQLRLVSLSALPHALQSDRSFSALFELSRPGALPQNTWEIAHPALGSHAVFLSPSDAQGGLLEAVFNRG
ncbi:MULTISPECIES: DUF6916 family protein [Delftia]|uniref:DUF6916 family protein n=1 Tax=Delftia deserti TaxID=1651218 RepID=A0ABW5EVW6_9BURK|nr:hypothetical protein [Delftia sp. UME58]MBB1652939.1 hypothetical protein [Delftia sp. UME58]